MAKSSRRSLKHTASNSSSRQSNINDLPDDLLEEIFCRLEYPSAVRCKSVTKRWYALISRPAFIRNLISHNHRLSQMQKEHNSQVLFSSAESLLNPKAPTLEAEAITRRFLLGFLKDYKVLGESNGWLCCNKRHNRSNIYYICNPLTNHWLDLPPAPSESKSRASFWGFGFLCDPYYHIDDKTQVVTLNTECRFVVVRFARFQYNPKRPRVQVFSSCTGIWSNLSLSGLNFIRGSSAVAFNGKFYLLCHERILKFDPFKNTEAETCTKSHCSFIDLPRDCVRPLDLVITSSGSLGVFQHIEEAAAVGIWELKEETWYLQEWKNIKQIVQNFKEACTILPKSDIFTLVSSIAAAHTKIVICPYDYNLARYKLHEEESFIYGTGNTALDIRYLRINVFPMVLPWWQGPPLTYPL